MIKTMKEHACLYYCMFVQHAEGIQLLLERLFVSL